MLTRLLVSPSFCLKARADIDHYVVRRRILNHVQDMATFEKKWKLAPSDADQFSDILTEWAKVMGTTAS